MKRPLYIILPIVLFLALVSLVFLWSMPRSKSLQHKVVLVSPHSNYGYYVTALKGGNWGLAQSRDLSVCGWFNLRYLRNGKVALQTCTGRYVTAPKTGADRADLRLLQKRSLGKCGQFVLHNLGRDGFALETCAGHFVTAGDAGWEGELAWAIVGETNKIEGWEKFQLGPPHTLPLSVLTNFDSCGEPEKRDREMAAFRDPSVDGSLEESYVAEAGRGCVARLEYDIVSWGGYWIRLKDADLRPYSQLVFDIRADSEETAPEQIKVELKRADLSEISDMNLPGITTNWQTKRMNLDDFQAANDRAQAFSLNDIEELVFVFHANEADDPMIVYLDNIALE